MQIDTHHHFWNYSKSEYGWMNDRMTRIQRDFGPGDLEKEIQAAGIDAVVSVQARQKLEETQFLLDYADDNDFIRGVVGWAPLVDVDVERKIERFQAAKKLKGYRHVLHDEEDDNYMLRPDFNRGVDIITKLGYRYDILIFEKHLRHTLQFVDGHPNTTFIVDHIAKPRIRDGLLSPWQSQIVQLAHRENVYCKISGMATEADWANWTPAQLKPYYETVLHAFGPKRLMFGSDWPVALVAVKYKEWVDTVRDWISELSDDEQTRIMGGTAMEAYGL